MENNHGIYLISGNEIPYSNLIDMLSEKRAKNDSSPIILKGIKIQTNKEYTFNISLDRTKGEIIKIAIVDYNGHIENTVYIHIHYDLEVDNGMPDIKDTILGIRISAVCGNLCTIDSNILINNQLVKVVGTDIGILIVIEKQIS